MTINIALITGEALVLGCDSVASTSDYYLDPFTVGVDKNPDGSIKYDADGKMTVKFKFDEMEDIITDAWGGVTKMFEIHPKPSPVVAVTAGLAAMCNRPVSSLGEEFYAKYIKRTKKLVKVDVIVKHFLKFMRQKYDENYQKSSLPPQLRSGPVFLVAGFGRDDEFPQLYRVNVKDNKAEQSYSPGETGVSWNGQSDAVERFIRGYDSSLRTKLEAELAKNLQGYQDSVTQKVGGIVNDILAAASAQMPTGVDTKIPDAVAVKLPWDEYKVKVGYRNLPLQEAINYVSFLVNLQLGKSRFAQGVATVGGRVHVGVITKNKGFELINEPPLFHRYTGFGDDT